MATNDFLTWATGTSPNVLTQSAYASLATLPTGVQSGIASSSQANKTWRQSSIIASMIAQAIVDGLNVNATDDGTIATLEANFFRLLRSGGTLYTTDTSTTPNSILAAFTPAVTALNDIDGQLFRIKVNTTNTGTTTIAINGLAATPIRQGNVALIGGELVAGQTYLFTYNATGGYFELLGSGGGTVNGTSPALAANNTQFATTAWSRSQLAAIGGNSTINFSVADASTGAQAVNYQQLTNQSFVPRFNSAYALAMGAGGNTTIPILWGFGNYGNAANSGTTNNLTAGAAFTANTKCLVVICGNAGTGSANVNGAGLTIGGASVVSNLSNWSTGSTFANVHAIAVAAQGAYVSMNFNVTATSSSVLNCGFSFFVIPIP